MQTTLDLKDGCLCVRLREKMGNRSERLEWYPIREAGEDEARKLTGRPVACVDRDAGLYVDEEGNAYRLKDGGGTFPCFREPDRSKRDNGVIPRLPEKPAVAGDSQSEAVPPLTSNPRAKQRLVRKLRTAAQATRERCSAQSPAGRLPGSAVAERPPKLRDVKAQSAPTGNLRQKLAEVRRRISYIQKRGYNPLHHYNYVTAADLAGAIGDILAELGVVLLPRLESITCEPLRSSPSQRLARVVMDYSFIDSDSGERLMVKVAGEGVDAGDKAPYKAMTGALKYALLQSFLIATGDDPENESAQPNGSRPALQPRAISEEQAREIHELVDRTGTELERVLEYYKVGSVEEMTEPIYRRAIEALNKKLSRVEQHHGDTHAQG